MGAFLSHNRTKAVATHVGRPAVSGLLTPVIAGIAVYIAWQQWQGNRLKLALDRYDRRLRVYMRVVEFLSLTLRDFKPEVQDVIKFRVETAEADFLFGAEIPAYLNDVGKRAMLMRAAHLEYRDYTQQPPEGYDHNKVVATMHEHELWFSEQHDAAKELFRRYLDIST